jgi:hypothetical protein
MTKMIIVITSISIVLFSQLAYANFSLLEFYCNGAVKQISAYQSHQMTKAYPFGDVKNGYLFENTFYTLDERGIVGVDLPSEVQSVVSGLKSVSLSGFHPFAVRWVDTERIIIEGNRPNNGKNKDWSFALFLLNRHSNAFGRLQLSISSGPISLGSSKMFYTGQDGFIRCYSEIADKSFGIKGRSPTVSPDESKIAFISYSVITEGVYIYEIASGRIRPLIKFFGPGSVNPLLRWSPDSRFLAVHKQSDLFSTSLFVINVLTGKTELKVKNNSACNWFFQR